MITLNVNSDDNLEKVISKFRKMVDKEGTVREVKRRRYFQKPSQLKHERNKTIKRKRIKNLRKKSKSSSDE